MKTLIATAAATLLSTSAFAFDASWDASEFYSGETIKNAIPAENLTGVDNSNLYLEGNFVKHDGAATIFDSAELGVMAEPAVHYIEGNYDV